MVRLFIGILVPENLKEKIVSVQGELSKLPVECKFVEKENLHVSLSFIGNVEDSVVEEIKTKLDNVCSFYKKFEVNVSGLKLISNQNYVRVIALDVVGDALHVLSKHIEKEIGGDVKPPHLTLCRVKNILDKKLFSEKIGKINFDAGKFVVENVHVVKSEMTREGPIYTSLYESFLSG